MSAVIMVRYNDAIGVMTDGMLSGECDPTLVGMMSKPIVLTHMPAVIAMTGDFVMLNCAMMFAGTAWVDFDELVENFRQAVGEQIEWALRNRPGLYEVGARYFVGGYSPKRQRWETYKMEVYAYYEDPWDGIGELEPSPQLEMAPAPDVDALVRYGFDAKLDDGRLDVQIPDLSRETLIRMMRAQRATEIGFGVRSEDIWTPGHMAGFFMEQTMVSHSAVLRQIVWRWPDEVGKPIDPANEGWPVIDGETIYEHDDVQNADAGLPEEVAERSDPAAEPA